MFPLDAIFGWFSQITHPSIAFFALTVSLVLLLLFYKRETSRLPYIAAVVLLSLALALALKPALSQPRPCALGMESAAECPLDYSLPSVHTAVAIALVVSTIGLRSFPIFFIYGYLVSLSRIYLGVHSIFDVGAGIALAVFSLAIIERSRIVKPVLLVHENIAKSGLFFAGKAPDELTRKLIQGLLGIGIFIYASLYGLQSAVIIVAYILSAGLVLFHMKLHKKSLPLVDYLLSWVERPNVPKGYGALTFFAGILLALSLIPNPGFALSTVFILSVSDGAAAIFGRTGKTKLPHHPQKTLRGSFAFFISSLPAMFIGGMLAGAVIVAATILESLDLRLDDNLVIPWAGVAVAVLFL